MEDASSSCTATQRLQSDLERAVGSLFEAFSSVTNNQRNQLLELCADHHETYVLRSLRRLSCGFYVLDSSRPWLCYWILHSLALLGRTIDPGLYNRAVSFLKHCEDPQGGYGGGPGQMPHLATTYAAVCALVTLGGEKALGSINREKTLQFLLRMKDRCGGFRVHDDGEMDMRGSYTAMAVRVCVSITSQCHMNVAHMLDVMVPELVENVGEYVRSCQTYEGGIGGEPGAEAHGGYTFCGLAAVALVDQLHFLDLPGLANWVAFRQGRVEGGFQGRTNKLVDGCYSFWQGGCFQVLQQYMPHLWSQQNSSMPALYEVADVFERKIPVSEAAMDADTREKESEGATVRLGEGASSSKTSPDSGKDSVIDLNPLTEALDTGETTVKSGMEDRGVGDSVPTTAVNSSSTVTAENIVDDDGEKFHSPTKEFSTAQESNSDEEDSEFWDSDNTSYNSAEKLFPMVEIGFRREPPHVTCIEVVEAPQDGVQDVGTGTSGSSGNSSRSTVELDSIDECLYGPIFNSQALQAYILLCCQDLDGGLRDKPGKSRDYYHTCYCLSGLSAAQYSTSHRVGGPPPPSGVLGPYSNLLEATHALCNVRLDRYYEARSFYQRLKYLRAVADSS